MTTISDDNKENTGRKTLCISIAVIAGVFTIAICLYQYLYFSRLRPINLSDYTEGYVDYSIDDIHWKDPDNDYILGRLSMDGKPVSDHPVRLVFYLDDSDTAYAIPAKLKNHVDPDQAAYNATLWPERDFMYIDEEYLFNAGFSSEYSDFYCLIRRDNPLRRTYKIGFLIDMDGTETLIKTDVVYKYES